MQRFKFEKAKNGKYDVHITLYDKNHYPFYERNTTLNKILSIPSLINTTIDCYKLESGFDKRKEDDKNKFIPYKVIIFTSPAFQGAVFNIKGKRLNEDWREFSKCNCYWK